MLVMLKSGKSRGEKRKNKERKRQLTQDARSQSNPEPIQETLYSKHTITILSWTYGHIHTHTHMFYLHWEDGQD